MKRYQKLIQDASEKSSFSQLAIAIETPSTSVHEWATHSYKVPQYKSLEKIAKYFNVSIPTLLMEHDDPLVLIIDELYRLRLEDQRLQVLLSFAKSL